MQTAIVALLGLISGSAVNWAIYALAWFHPRPISPWSKPPAGIVRRPIDYVPVIGWLARRDESPTFGRGFWIRPLLLELSLALGMAWLFQLELSGALIPQAQLVVVPPDRLYAQFAVHAVLILFMTVATFIDFDEQTIPDSITIPGTLIGLTFAALLPQSALAITVPFVAPTTLISLTITGEFAPPAWFHGLGGFVLGAFCFVGWCYALVPKTCTLRRGLWKGWLYLHASTLRTPHWKYLLELAVVGMMGIFIVWMRGGQAWLSLLSALFGMAFGGGLIWAVRIVGYVALRKEAMGFGDVTLMGMIGAVLGWQSTILVFFLAPIAAVVIALAQWILTRRRDIAFGPYLCAGALLLIVDWPDLWIFYAAPAFSLGWLLPGLLFAGLLLMMGLLMLWRQLEGAIRAVAGTRE